MTATVNTFQSLDLSEPLASPLVSPVVSAVTQNRRNALRTSRPVDAQLTSMGSLTAIGCRMVDISENGAYVSAFASANLSVGQRFQIELSKESDAPDLASALCQGCYATIVRTERRVSDGDSAIGAGLRFDRPIYL